MSIKGIIPKNLWEHVPQILESEQLKNFVSDVTGDIKERMEKNQELSKRINDALNKYEGLE